MLQHPPAAPHFRAEWDPDIVCLLIDADTDWQELAELLTDRCCPTAPLRLAGRVDRSGA